MLQDVHIVLLHLSKNNRGAVKAKDFAKTAFVVILGCLENVKNVRVRCKD